MLPPTLPYMVTPYLDCAVYQISYISHSTSSRHFWVAHVSKSCPQSNPIWNEFWASSNVGRYHKNDVGLKQVKYVLKISIKVCCIFVTSLLISYKKLSWRLPKVRVSSIFLFHFHHNHLHAWWFCVPGDVYVCVRVFVKYSITPSPDPNMCKACSEVGNGQKKRCSKFDPIPHSMLLLRRANFRHRPRSHKGNPLG